MAWNRGEGSSCGIKFDKGGGFGKFWGLNWEKEELDEFVALGSMGIHQGAGFQLIDGNCEPLGMNFREGLNDGHGLTDGE
ncbi:hypothetical protein KY284_010148 [Solanum tuberosum]|nr:hypothetical protein KY284_010148 [Solanum tuberosum]